MAITITLDLRRDFTFNADFDAVFDLLADVPESTSHFPKLKKLTVLGDNCFRWEMEEVGVDRYSIQSIYASCYRADRDKGQILWTPVEGEGNGRVGGGWYLIKEGDTRTAVQFRTDAELTLPLPRLVKMAVSPVVKHEFNALVDKYIVNLRKALE